jgi:UDP-N-acetylmuramoyl-L-alanyl-D-glutamate--2,6-diaminopimelate ligase
MRLRDLIADVAVEAVSGDMDTDVTALAYDSRKVTPGTLFFCFAGADADGHDFAAQAVDDGAAALACERPLELDVPQVVVSDARTAMAPLAARFFGDPTAELQVAGITGTNGKTTTAYLLRGILDHAQRPSGLLGTVKQVIGGAEGEVERTTPEAIDMQETFRRMVDTGDVACVMEVSSHALALHRADSIHFDVAVFTNLTQDHLDFHADMDDYFLAKRRLFDLASSSVINIDDQWGRRLAGEIDCLTFSAGGEVADFLATDISFDAGGARFRAVTPAGEAEVQIPLPGDFNVSNALAAIAAAHVMGVEVGDATKALAGAEQVPGRFEPIDEGQPFAVLVDYAHTPDSLENVLHAARRLTDGQLICVFGCGGDRDRAKRPLMGRIGAELADRCLVTSDNPRSEEPKAIIDEILAGIANGDKERIRVETDRRAAIATALASAGKGDTVVIAGKGHEQGQEFEEGRRLPFDDREVAREELRRS